MFASFLVSACRDEPPVPPAAHELAARMVAGKLSADGAAHPLHYRLFVPARHPAAAPSGAEPSGGGRYPLVVFLHGAGSHGTDNVRQLSGPVAALIDGLQSIDAAFVLVPQDPAGDKWVKNGRDAPYRNYRQVECPQTEAARLVLAAVDEVSEKYPVDPDRIYLTGGSAGGTGTWDLITRGGVGRFAAAVPVTGANDPSRAAVIQGLPIWAFHGARDTVAPVENTREMVASLRALGSSVRYTEYTDVGHESWHRAYAEPELFRWLLAQRRSGTPD